MGDRREGLPKGCVSSGRGGDEFDCGVFDGASLGGVHPEELSDPSWAAVFECVRGGAGAVFSGSADNGGVLGDVVVDV